MAEKAELKGKIIHFDSTLMGACTIGINTTWSFCGLSDYLNNCFFII